MRFSRRFMSSVTRFERCCTHDMPGRTVEGLRQFLLHENGEGKPTDAYGMALVDGKRWWEWTVNEYASLRGTSEWPGWAAIEADFTDDPQGFRMIRQRCGA